MSSEPSNSGQPESTGTTSGELPVNRNYDWDEYRLDDDEVQSFVSPEGVQEEIMELIEKRHQTQLFPRFTLSGPTGTAKTLAARNVAAELDAPFFSVQCSDGLREEDMIGMPTFVGNETRWTDGECVKALLSSREQPTVLLLDEVNRAPERAKFVLFSMLDDRCELEVRARGERVQGNPMNLIVFATMNEGEGYIVNRMDKAESRRLGMKWDIDHLGLSDVEAEARLVANRTPLCYTLSLEFVKVANEIRRNAKRENTTYDMGLPNAVLLSWARAAHGLKDVTDDPVMEALEKQVVNPHYSETRKMADAVRSIVQSHLAGAPVETEAAREHFHPDEGNIEYACQNCDWSALPEDTATYTKTFNTCPECDTRDSVRVLPRT